MLKSIALKELVLLKVLAMMTLLMCSLFASAAPDDISAKVKAAYVYNFIKYIEWPNNDAIDIFYLGIYGDDLPYKLALQQMQGMKVKQATIHIVDISSLEQLPKLHMMVLDKRQSKNIQKITNKLVKKHTLLISDHATAKKHTMLNFLETEQKKLTFELNRYQMLNVNLKVSHDILVLGGSELDIANVLKEMDATITLSLAEISKQSSKLTQLEDNISSREKKLIHLQSQFQQQQNKLNSQTKLLDSQHVELEQNKNDFAVMQTNFHQVKQEFMTSQELLTKNTESLSLLKNDITQKEQAIDYLATRIDERKKELTAIEQQRDLQAQELTKQSNVIETQSTLLIIAGIAVIAILFSLVVIYKSKQLQHRANQALQENLKALAKANTKLSSTQAQLIESEKMAALGGLVAGVAHEINTPIGISVTASSHLSDQIAVFNKEYTTGQLKKSSLERLLLNANESSSMIMKNLQRASELITNFKQVAVDQSSEDRRKFELTTYLKELIQSLRPQYKQQGHSIKIISANEIPLNSFPGVFAQIFTNLIMNSLHHGFIDKTQGEISITLILENNEITIDYCDNGTGLTDQQREKVFEPFYTTARSTGGSGLGMSISYNLVSSKLNGNIKSLPSVEGAHFQMTFAQSL